MGERGPAPVPRALLEARGSRRATQNPKEPKPEAGRPICPSWLSPAAKAVWKETVGVLKSMNVLTKADGLTLRRYCYMVVSWRRCQEFIDKHGDTYPQKDKAGDVIAVRPFPQAKLALELNDRLLRAEKEFGLTPSARTRLEAINEAEPEASGKLRFFQDVG